MYERLKVFLDVNIHGRYIKLIYDSNSYTFDFEVARLMGVSLEYYNHLLMYKFNAIVIDKSLYFSCIEDSEKAKKWLEENIEYYLIMKELNPNNILDIEMNK